MLLSDNFSQLRAVQFLAWFANIIGESELTWERKKWQLRDGAGNNSKSTFILWLEDRKGSKSWVELESGWGKELGYFFLCICPTISLYYKIFSKMLKDGPEGLTQLDTMKIFRKVLANRKVCAKQKTPKKYYILQNFLYFWKKKRWISSEWVWVYFFSDQTLAS